MKNETKALILSGLMLTLFIGSCSLVARGINAEFAGCKGLEGVVNQIWSGEPCANS